MSAPGRLLELLSGQPQSAAELTEQLGSGPKELEALMEQLKGAGVPLEESAHGHALAPGTPTPALMRAAGFADYRYLAQVGSTQDELRRWADDPISPAPAGAVVLAETQTAGRGRRGRNWQTERQPGSGLTFSVLLPKVSLAELPLVPLAAGVALREACRAALPPGAARPSLKWPNDLLTPQGRKLAGSLLEVEWRGSAVRRAVLGIGLNISAAPEGAACLADLAPHPNRAEVLVSLLRQLPKWLTAAPERLLAAWRSDNLTLGQAVRVQTAAGLIVGQAQDLTERGELLVLSESGELLTIGAGDVALIGALEEAAELHSGPHFSRSPSPHTQKEPT